MKANWLAILSLATASVCPAVPGLAQAPVITADALREAAAPSGKEIVDLPVAGTPGTASTVPEQWFQIWDQYGVRNVSRPTLTVVRPKPGTGNGTAVIVVPGGGFSFLSWSNEGQPVAEWLAARGITAFVLKYRTNQTPRTNAGYLDFVRSQIAKANDPNRRFSALPQEAGADARQAIRYVRTNASRWNVSPDRVGYIGFSAGAVMGVAAAVSQDEADRPSFLASIYGPAFSRSVPDTPPPLFMARAFNDPLFAPISKVPADSFGLLTDWQARGGSVEFHLYSSGGHGFGVQKNKTSTELLLPEFYQWLVASRLI